MATHIEITRGGVLAPAGTMPVETGLVASQTITPSGSNQVTAFSITVAVANGDPLFATVTADENVFISIGSSPNALTDTAKRAMVAGGVRSFAIAPGQQVAVVTR